MKKIIIGVLAVVAIGFGGVIAANATATNGPDMSLKTDVERIDTFKDTIFETTMSINTGSVISSGADPDNIPYTLKGGKIKLDNIIDFELISAELTTKEFRQGGKPEAEVKVTNVVSENNEISLGDLNYIYTGVGVGGAADLRYTMQGPTVDIKLKMKAKNIGTDDWQLNDLIKVTYLNYDGNKDVGVFEDPAHHAVPISVSEITYKMGSITGVERDPIQTTLGKYFELFYTVNPGSLVTTNSVPMPQTQGGNRNLVYVVDKNVIDKVGGNEETARASMIKALEETMKENPNTTASLVVYGENAEIVKVNDKMVFTLTDLIAQISNIEASEKSGNIGDAIRMTQLLVNETDGEDSIVIVSGGDSNYYTQVSEGNSSMLSTRIEKAGFIVEDKEKADEYANDVVNDIVINEEDETRWYAVNYALESEEVLVNDLMEKLEGNTLNVVKPYYDNFNELNTKAIAPLVLKANLVATAVNKSLEIHPDDKDKDIELIFNNDGTTIIGETQNLTVRVKANNMDGMSDIEIKAMGYDVANPLTVEVKLVVEFGEGEDKVKEYIFNSPTNTLEPGQSLLTWYMKPSIPYVASVGLHNGRLTLPKGTLERDENKDIIDIGAISSQLLEVAPEFDLAEENHFGFGMLIKSQSEGDTFEVITRMSEADEKPVTLTENIKLYELNKEKFILSEDKTLNPNKIYLITVDYYIDGKKVGEVPGQSFEIGVNLTTNDILEPVLPTEGDAGTGEVKSERKTEFWGIKVNTVEKPEHF